MSGKRREDADGGRPEDADDGDEAVDVRGCGGRVGNRREERQKKKKKMGGEGWGCGREGGWKVSHVRTSISHGGSGLAV